MTPTISVTGLTRRYRDQLALDDVTVDIDGPSITGLLGRNGAGKTTLMRIIAARSSPRPAPSGFSAPTRSRTRRSCAGWSWSARTRRSPISGFATPCGRRRGSTRTGAPSPPRRSWRDFDLRRTGRWRSSPAGCARVGRRDRAGGASRGHAVRRALRRPRRGGPAAVLRPAAGRLRRAPAHGRLVHASDRRGRRACSSGWS